MTHQEILQKIERLKNEIYPDRQKVLLEGFKSDLEAIRMECAAIGHIYAAFPPLANCVICGAENVVLPLDEILR